MTSHLFLWPSAPEIPQLDGCDVHVWCASLDLPALQVKSLQGSLSEDERNRAAQYQFQKDRNHFIVARGRLREILGRYLNLMPKDVRFSYGPYGKPTLAKNLAKYALQFNASHSGGIALYAITLKREVGVDLEKASPKIIEDNIADNFFSRREVEELQRLPEQLQQKAFFSCWVRKEAYIKARGEGLQLELDSFDVSIVPGEPATLLRSGLGDKEISRWSIHDLDVGSDYVAALVVEGHDVKIKCWQWTESSS